MPSLVVHLKFGFGNTYGPNEFEKDIVVIN